MQIEWTSRSSSTFYTPNCAPADNPITRPGNPAPVRNDFNMWSSGITVEKKRPVTKPINGGIDPPICAGTAKSPKNKIANGPRVGINAPSNPLKNLSGILGFITQLLDLFSVIISHLYVIKITNMDFSIGRENY
ncbi:MAG: hypothetical protein P1U88_03805 [Thalassobaculaceae bacterium]|nr:hypothetical protein [Thalassobaculaceae bacterium]